MIMKNNKFKIFLFILLLGILIIPKITTISAEEARGDSSYTITIKGSSKNHTFEAYQVFKGDLNTEDGKDVLSNIKWGNGVNGDSLLTALKVDSTSINKMTESGSANQKVQMSELFKDCTTARDVAEVLDLYKDNSDMAIAFAEVVSSNLNGTKISANATSDTNEYTITVSGAGYYFIKDTTENLKQNDFYTRYIMKIIKDSELTVKGDVPSITKDVAETSKFYNDSSLNHSDNLENKKAVSAEIGEALEFTLTGTLPTNYVDYNTYKYIFHDTLSKGLTFKDGSVKLYILKKDNTLEEVTDTNKFTIANSKAEGTENTTLTITINDLKQIIDNTKYTEENDYKVIVKYYAYLNENAIIGSTGNPNTVYLEFSNDPNKAGSEKTSNTPEDKVTIYTYQLNINKKDGKKNTALANVGFKLYRKDSTKTYYAKLKNSDTKEYIIDGWTENESEATEMLTDSEGHLKMRGLEDGIYYLKESTTPKGYNTIEDVEINITETITGNEPNALDSAQALTELSINVKWKDNEKEQTSSQNEGSKDTGIVETTILNMPGSILPFTGGIGSLLFYVIGIVLVITSFIIIEIKYKKHNKVKEKINEKKIN